MFNHKPATKARLAPAIRRELTAIAGPENCLFEQPDLFTYGYDAGSQTALPQAVVFPGSSEQVSAITQVANRLSVPLVPRGAGSGLTGGAVPARGGIVLSFQRMRRILEIDEANQLCVVEPGVVNGDLQKALQDCGLFFPPDPASAEFSTIGGNIAENAGGIRAVKYGVTKDYVMGLEVVLPSGDIIRTGSKCKKDVVGYDLTELFVGSEGTLGTITRAILKLVSIPEARQTLIAFFPDMARAANLVASARRREPVPAVMEFMDHECLRALDAARGDNRAEQARGMLLIELDGTAHQVKQGIHDLVALCRQHGASDVQEARTPEERSELWTLRRGLHASLHLLQEHWFEEDISVPAASIPVLLESLQSIAVAHDLIMANFGHMGDGNVHISFQGKRTALSGRQCEQVRRAIYRATVALEGRIAAEHGIGLDKMHHIGWNLNPATLKFMATIKQTIDPRNILNPGKVFPL